MLITKFVSEHYYFCPIRWVPRLFFKIQIICSQNLHFNLVFRIIFENYSMCMLSIRGHDFIAHWANEEWIFANPQPGVKCEQFLHVHCISMLSICGTNFIAHWAYVERILSHTEHTRKCLKVEYLGQIEYYFQISRVTCPWDRKVSVSEKKA
jgi:hypothetical protein